MQEVRSFNPNEAEPPHSIEAEQQILGALLMDNRLIQKIDGAISAADFYDPVHADVFAAIVDRIEGNQIASPVTINHAMSQHKGLSEIGGGGYLVRMAASAISSFAIAEYAQIVTDNANKRRLLDVMRDAHEKIINTAKPVSEIAEKIETSAGGLLANSNVKPLIRSHLSSVIGALDEINIAYQGETAIGVSTGLPQLDAKIGMLRPTNLLVLAGRPGMGKTTVAQNIAYSAAMGNVGVFFASLEMSGEDLGKRFLSKGLAEEGNQVAYNSMINGRLSEEQMRLIVDEARRQESLPIITGERDVRKVSRLRAAARRAQQQLDGTAAPLGLIVVDYVQRIASDDPRMGIRERVSEATDMLKSLAMEMNLPVIALAQLSREVERRESKIPMLSDLKESGSLEEDADVVMFCYRHAYYLEKELSAIRGGNDFEREADLRAEYERCAKDLDLIVAKQRSGPEGTVRAYIDPGLCHISKDRAREEDQLI
ncbi:DnaB-like helicase C-terminal domain-containing protein [Roseovarius sp. MMSF_3281]|uniref:replicative DNA helicase n=1 Tax=Roseovarius sp. MMSF_3281 TaxID=3046694 RepID=UPI00273F9C37|nr:DnaB-like helicase C-terminal domain-containing protein [Roseovarius sp. MMSF_3281]